MMTSESNPYNTPMRVEDAASMFRRRVQLNDRPFVAITTKLNNKMVDNWKKTILSEIADNRGTVPSARIWGSWKLYLEGFECKNFAKMKKEGLLPEVDKKVINYWKNFFEKLTVEEMHSYGSGTVSTGWGIIQNYMKVWFAQRKWDEFYSKKPNDPLWWEKNFIKYKSILNGEALPFWNENRLKEIQQKVGAILFNQVNPQGTRGFK